MNSWFPTSYPQRKPTETGLGSAGGRAGIDSLANFVPASCHPPQIPWRCLRISGGRRDGQHDFQRALGLSNLPPCSELALKIQYPQTYWGERRMGFGIDISLKWVHESHLEGSFHSLYNTQHLEQYFIHGIYPPPQQTNAQNRPVYEN